MPNPARRDVMTQLAIVLQRLSAYGIRNAADYAEILVAEAVGGQRIANLVHQGHDVVSPKHGRVEVKHRRLPPDGRIEERVELKPSKKGGFDYLAIVVFYSDFSVKGAVLVPYSRVWGGTGKSRFNRTSYSQACELPGAIDITSALRQASER